MTQTSVTGSNKVLLGSFILSNPPLGETILRTRIRLDVTSDQAAAAEFMVGAFGLIVVTDRAIASGAAAIPGPATDGGDDGWFVHQSINQSHALAGGGVRTYDIDSKAMRKVEDGGEIAIMVQNAGLAASGGFLITTSVRLLAKLTES